MTVRLDGAQAVFIGLKLDSQMKRQLDGVEGVERRYVSSEETDFLTLCRLGDDEYVGKVVEDRLTTRRVEDVRRNVLSILRRLLPDTRFPDDLEIVGVVPPEPAAPAAAAEGTEESGA